MLFYVVCVVFGNVLLCFVIVMFKFVVLFECCVEVSEGVVGLIWFMDGVLGWVNFVDGDMDV